MAAAIPIVDVNRADLPAIARNIEELEDIPFRGVIDPTLCYILSGAEHAYALTQDTLNHYRSDDSKFYKCHVVLDEQALGVRDDDYDRTPGNELYRFNLAATYYIKKSIADQLSIGVVYRIHDSDEPVGPIVSERYFIDVAQAVENAAVGAEKCHIVYPDMIQNVERLNIVAPAAAAAAAALLPVPAGLPAVGLEAVRAEINNIDMLVGPLMGRYYDGEEERFVADHAADGVVYNQIANALPVAIEHLRAAVTPDNMAAAQGELNVLHNLIVNLNREAIRGGPGALPGAVAPPALPLAPIALPNVGDPPGHPPNGLANGGPPDGNAGDPPGAPPGALPAAELAVTLAEVTAEVDDLEVLQNQLRDIYYEGGAARAAPNAEDGRVLYNSINFIVPGVLERLRAVVTPDTAAAAQAQLDRIIAAVSFVTNDGAFAGLRVAPGAVAPIALPIEPIVVAAGALPEVPIADAGALADVGEAAEVPAEAPPLNEAPAEVPADVGAEVPAEVPAEALPGAPPAVAGAPAAEAPPPNEAPAEGDAAAPALIPNEAPADAGVPAAALPGAPAPQVVPPAPPAAAGPFAQLFAARAAAVARPPAAAIARPLPPAPVVAAAPHPLPPAPPAPIGGPAGGPPAVRPAPHPGLDIAAILARVGPRVGARVRPAGLPPI